MIDSVLIAHSNQEVRERLASALAPRSVTWVQDPFGVPAEVARKRFAAIIIEHPLLGVGANLVAQEVRKLDQECSIFALAEHLTDREALTTLRRSLGKRSGVIVSLSSFLEAMTRGRKTDSAATMGATEGPSATGQSDLSGYEGGSGDVRLAIRSALGAEGLGVPGKLIACLDGSRTARELVAETGLPEEDVADFLRKLESEDCLELVVSAELVSDDDHEEGEVLEDAVEPRSSVANETANVVEPSAQAMDLVAGDISDDPEVSDTPSTWGPEEPSRQPDRAGTLATISAPQLLLDLGRERATGILVIEGPGWRMRLDIARGAPVRGSGGPDATGLGQILLQLKYLDASALEQLLREQRRSGKPLGDVAVKSGHVHTSQLLAALWAQMEKKVLALLPLQEGPFRFYRDDGPLEMVGSERLPLETLIEEGIRSDEALRKRLLDSFLEAEQHHMFRVNPTADDLLPRFRFGGRVQRLLRQLEGRTLRQLLVDPPLPEQETLLMLWLLCAAGGLSSEAGGDSAQEGPAGHLLGISGVPGHHERPVVAGTNLTMNLDGSGQVEDSSTSPQFQPQPTETTLTELVEGGEAALAERDFPRALHLLRRARDEAPHDANVLAALGWAVFRSQPVSEKSQAEAQELLREALRQDPRLIDAHNALGRIARLKGRLADARRSFEEALAIDPHNQTAREELLRIEMLHEPEEEPPPQGISNDEPESSGAKGLFRRIWKKR